MLNSKQNSKAPYGSYLWFKQVEAKHQDDFKDWPVSKKAEPEPVKKAPKAK